MKTSTARGFTLIELLVVIAIIGILSSVVLASLNSARQKSRDARRLSDLKQIQLALELYYDANDQTYPITGALSDIVTDGFISVLPADPQGSTAYEYNGIDSSDGDCTTGETCTSYVLGADMEGDKPTGGVANTLTDPDCTATVDDANLYCVAP